MPEELCQVCCKSHYGSLALHCDPSPFNCISHILLFDFLPKYVVRTLKNKKPKSCNRSFGTGCNFVCKSKGILAEHYKNTHENPAHFCVQCGFRTDSQIEMDAHKLEHELKKKNMESLDPGDETVSAVDSLVTYAVEQVRAFVIFILLEKSKKM